MCVGMDDVGMLEIESLFITLDVCAVWLPVLCILAGSEAGPKSVKIGMVLERSWVDRLWLVLDLGGGEGGEEDRVSHCAFARIM